jgi:hypothetical protein
MKIPDSNRIRYYLFRILRFLVCIFSPSLYIHGILGGGPGGIGRGTGLGGGPGGLGGLGGGGGTGL